MMKRWINPNDYIRMKIQPMDFSMIEINIHGRKDALIHVVNEMMKRWINPNDYICMKIQPMDLSMEKNKYPWEK
ncbi:MAG: hypothetical protein ACKOX1_07875 [Ignavibacteria bacterium]